MYPQVSIIILNWNGWEDTIECLESLYQINYPNYNVIVVDNGSKDESIEKIKEYAEGKNEKKSEYFTFDPDNKPIKIIEYTNKEVEVKTKCLKKYSNIPSNKKLILIKNDQNYGFAEGNNIAIRYSMSDLNIDYVLLLNNDTIVDENFLSEMIKSAENDKNVGLVGSKIYYYDYNGKRDIIWYAGGELKKWCGKSYNRGINKIDSAEYDNKRECGYINGCSMLIRNQVLSQSGAFDKIYFVYYEDTDLSMRSIENGWKNIYVPTSKVWHKVSKSSVKIGKKFSPLTVYYTTRNNIIFVKKHNNKLIYLIFLIYYLTYRHLRRLVNFLLIQKDFELIKSYYKGLIDGLFVEV